jgi:crystallin alpha B
VRIDFEFRFKKIFNSFEIYFDIQNWMDVPIRRHFPLLSTRFSHDIAEMTRRMDDGLSLNRMDDGVRVVSDAHKFSVQMDVAEYRPEEIDVKVGNEHDAPGQPAYLIVSGKHEEKRDGHGHVSRSFTRRYTLPTDVDMQQLACNVSDKGVLTLHAPRVQPALTGVRVIPITHVASTPDRQNDIKDSKLKKGATTNGA